MNKSYAALLYGCFLIFMSMQNNTGTVKVEDEKCMVYKVKCVSDLGEHEATPGPFGMQNYPSSIS